MQLWEVAIMAMQPCRLSRGVAVNDAETLPAGAPCIVTAVYVLDEARGLFMLDIHIGGFTRLFTVPADRVEACPETPAFVALRDAWNALYAAEAAYAAQPNPDNDVAVEQARKRILALPTLPSTPDA